MTSQKGFAHAVLIIGLVVALVGALGFVFWQNFIYQEPVVTKTEVQVVKKPEDKTEASTAPTNQPAAVIHIADLGLQVTVPGELADLITQRVHLEGDQAVETVLLSSKKAEAAGCNRAEAPLGYLTYNSNKGGLLVANARHSDIFYLATNGACSAITSQDIDSLKVALRNAVADTTQ